jgi:hypothetical protein
VLTILAAVGLACFAVGSLMKNRLLVISGLALVAPLLLGGVLALIIGLPMALVVRLKEKKYRRSTKKRR